MPEYSTTSPILYSLGGLGLRRRPGRSLAPGRAGEGIVAKRVFSVCIFLCSIHLHIQDPTRTPATAPLRISDLAKVLYALQIVSYFPEIGVQGAKNRLFRFFFVVDLTCLGLPTWPEKPEGHTAGGGRVAKRAFSRRILFNFHVLMRPGPDRDFHKSIHADQRRDKDTLHFAKCILFPGDGDAREKPASSEVFFLAARGFV